MFILLQAALLGLVAGLTPGPMLTALLVNTLQGGARTGFRTLVWIMLWEILVTSSLILVATLLPLSPAVFGAIGIVGGIVLLYLAWQVFQVRGIQAHATGALFTPRKLLLLQATNPHLYVFWITIGLPLIFQMSQTWTLAAAAISFFVVFEIVFASTKLTMLLLFLFARQTLSNERIMHAVFVAVSLLLLTLGLQVLSSSFQALIF